MEFDDEYPTCEETYATLRVFSDQLNPDEIAQLLGLEATDSFARGQPFGPGRVRRNSGWFLSTRNRVVSRDSRRHLAWLLDSLRLKAAPLKKLRETGAEIDISCYYLSSGQGGPTMSAVQMAELGSLGLDLWWDVYFIQTD